MMLWYQINSEGKYLHSRGQLKGIPVLVISGDLHSTLEYLKNYSSTTNGIIMDMPNLKQITDYLQVFDTILSGDIPIIIFADIKEDTFNIDPEEVKNKITDKTKAIIAVDLYGQPADYKRLKEIADEHNLIIIEDACQAVNAELNNRKAGSLGDIAAFSFYATKNMMSGEGGMITTDNEEYVNRFGYLDKSCLAKNGVITDNSWRPYMKGENKIRSYGPTLAVVVPTQKERAKRKKEVNNNLANNMKRIVRILFKKVKEFYIN